MKQGRNTTYSGMSVWHGNVQGSKQLRETLYHIAASMLYFASALYLLIYLTNKTYRDTFYVAKTAASVSNR
ncbi:hypothetical protein E2C01_020335 [Portunus trituberculatus]|uniref:Uncharacterized protein n=1 Tax=Portunus trituberculatus TaxID=210409 RepID=A0A5B7DZU4_PORTR|nr:hypothetical protein [Portunus trituberculatus]